MNPYVNLLKKVKLLLKEDDQLTKAQCEMFQWQQLVKLPDTEYSFTVGKGGVNTIFYSLSSAERAVCYPEDILPVLETLAKGKVFVYAALDKTKEVVGYSVLLAEAKKIKGARYIAPVDFKGKVGKVVEKKIRDLQGNKIWKS